MMPNRAALLFCLSLPLFGQTCVTFSGAEIYSALSPDRQSITALVEQADNSYTAVIGTTSPPYTIVNVVPNFDQWIASCVAPPVSVTLPPAMATSTPIGTAFGVGASGDFLGNGIPGAAGTATGNPQPFVSLGQIVNGQPVRSTVQVPEGAATVGTADFNNDGKVDLAVVYTGVFNGSSETAGGVAILLGNGDGTFQNAVSYPAGADSLSATIADLNGDGKLDIAVAADSGSVTIFLGNGDGTFRAGPIITASMNHNPDAVIAADFNGDHKLDLATSNQDGTVSIMLGNGDGTFQPAQAFPAGRTLGYLAAGDFNKDGKPDLAVADFGGNFVEVLLGKGDGTFGAPSTYNTTNFPAQVIVTDFNHDGNLDIVTGSGSPAIIGPDYGSGNIGVLLGNGDGTFQGGGLYSTSGIPYSVATADLNGDGLPDLVTANQFSHSLSVLLNQGKGIFKNAPDITLPAGSSSSSNPVGVALGDLNRDGKTDVAAAVAFGSVAVSLGNGDGTFQAPTFYATQSGSLMVAIGDLNGDGNPDLAVANGPVSLPGSVSILLGAGGGKFGAANNITTADTTVVVALSDVNGDGKLDMVVLNGGSLGEASDPGGVQVFLGKGDGTFQPPASYAVGNNPSTMAVGDVNGDGKPDLVVGTYDLNFVDYVAVMLGNGDGTFKSPVLYGGQFGMSDVVLTDLNGDGKIDVVIASCCGDTQPAYLLGNGDGTFQPDVIFNGGPSPYWIAVADYNGDGKPDLAIADQQSVGAQGPGFVTVLLNTTQVSAFVTKSATAGQVEPFAADSIVAAYGANLAVGTLEAATLPLPVTLDGTTVTVTDSLGVSRQAPLFYVSSTQVNYEIPDGTAPGTATVTITNKNGTVQTATIQVGSVSPGLFVLNASGLVAAWVLPVVDGVQQNLEPIYQITNGAVVGAPLNVAAAGTSYYLEMYGTGIRNAKNVTATVGSVSVPVLFSGPAPGYAGEDQVNIGPLPTSLAGQGTVNIILQADGQAANTVTVTIQ